MSIKNFILFALTLVQFTASGQTTEKVVASVTYKVTVIRNGITGVEDICQLDIGRNTSYFFSRREKENRKLIEDKIAKSNATGISLNFSKGEIITNYYKYPTIIDHISKKAIVLETFSNDLFGSVASNLNIHNWKILSDTLTINKLLCRKAELKRDTTSITAWFCADIPFQDGPFSYYGLPGLIIKLNTTNGSEALLTELSYNKNEAKFIELPNYTLISPEQMIKARANSRNVISNGRSVGGSTFKLEKKEN